MSATVEIIWTCALCDGWPAHREPGDPAPVCLSCRVSGPPACETCRGAGGRLTLDGMAFLCETCRDSAREVLL